MKQFGKYCILNHSYILSMPFLSDLIYAFQILLLSLNLSENFVASNTKSLLRNFFFERLILKYKSIYCQSINFERTLVLLTECVLILDLPLKIKINSKNKQALYNLMWSLVYCNYITAKTRHTVKIILPTNYPVVKSRA